VNDIQKVYFIGIGGIGMSALARYFNGRNVEVFGYDKTATTLTKKLVEEGMIVHFEDDISQIPEGVDLVVYTPAIPDNHRELNYFRKHNFPLKKRAEVLGMISRTQRTIAVAGTHGKTTTTSILTHLLQEGGVDCTAFLGGIANNFSSNYVEGKSDWVVVEADEYDRSFLHLHPEIAVILSMDSDHLDIYGAGEEVKNSFRIFGSQVKNKGKLIVNQKWIAEYLKKDDDQNKVNTYGLESGDYYADNIRVTQGYFVFDFKSKISDIVSLQFTLPGHHNIENATAAIAVALELGVSVDAIRRSLVSFKGIKRRFEIIYRDEKVVYIDDYAHHPSELKAAIHAARTLFPNQRITGVFQPHLFSRTRDFLSGFAEELSSLDEVILLDIYPARELPIAGITSEAIYKLITNDAKVLATKQNLLDLLATRDLEVLMTLGAGDIDTLVAPIKKQLIHG